MFNIDIMISWISVHVGSIFKFSVNGTILISNDHCLITSDNNFRSLFWISSLCTWNSINFSFSIIFSIFNFAITFIIYTGPDASSLLRIRYITIRIKNYNRSIFHILNNSTLTSNYTFNFNITIHILLFIRIYNIFKFFQHHFFTWILFKLHNICIW